MVVDSKDALQRLQGHLPMIHACIYRLARCLCNNHASESSSLLADPKDVNLAHFPYDASNASVYIDTCKLLYILDVYPTLETCTTASIPNIHPSDLLLAYLRQETSHYEMDIGEISVKLSSRLNTQRSFLGTTGPLSSALDRTRSQSVGGDSTNDSRPLSCNPVIGLSALEVLHTVLLMVLTVCPMHYHTFYTTEHDIYQNNHYLGKLAECEESSIQLLLLAQDATLYEFFHASNMDTWHIYTLPALQVRRQYVGNSLVRICSRLLLKAKQMDSHEKCATLTPTLVSIVEGASPYITCLRRLMHSNASDSIPLWNITVCLACCIALIVLAHLI